MTERLPQSDPASHKTTRRRGIRILADSLLLALVLLAALYGFFHDFPHTLRGKIAMAANSVVTTFFRQNTIGDYRDYSYSLHRIDGIFSSDGSVLIADYEQEAFEEQLKSIDRSYRFLTEQITDEKHCWILSPPSVFRIGNWTFRTLDESQAENRSCNSFPKSIQMIAVNEQSMRIAYLDFYDSDLDYLAEQGETDYMESFIKENFSVNFRKTP